MARSVNKNQSDIMLSKMLNNRSIACGFVKLSKEVVAEFWKSLSDELNSAGPPIKNVTEWKKVWSDQKRYVRSKAATNLKNQQKTGGGPNQTKCLSASEQCIYDIVGMKESVEGLENSMKFGLPDSFGEIKEVDLSLFDLPERFDGNAKLKEPTKLPVCQYESVLVCDDVPCSSKMVTPPPQDPILNKESSSKKVYSLKRMKPQDKITTADLIAKEVKTQENLCSKIEEIGNSIQTHNKEMGIAIKRIYRALEKNNDLKAKKLKMLEQHHKAMEQLRMKEVESIIEKNNKLVRIEEMKIKI